jgi:hypothetical protein
VIGCLIGLLLGIGGALLVKCPVRCGGYLRRLGADSSPSASLRKRR